MSNEPMQQQEDQNITPHIQPQNQNSIKQEQREADAKLLDIFDKRLDAIAGGPCCVKINLCAKEQIIVTDGTTTYSNVYGRCGNYLQLGQIAGNVRRWNCLHFAVTTNPAGNLQCLDKLCAPQVGPDVVSGVTVTSTPAAFAAASY